MRWLVTCLLALALAGCAEEGVRESGDDVGAVPAAAEGWPTGEVVLSGPDGGEVRTRVWIADEPDRRERGFQGWSHVPEGWALLFVFPSEHDGGFWMRDVAFPLDIVFIDETSAVTHVEVMDTCEDDCPVHRPDDPYVAALEAPEGVFTGAGVAPGWEAEISE